MPTINPQKLKYFRKLANYKQGPLAEKLGWSQSRLSQYENPALQDRKEIDGEPLDKLASLLGCEREDLIVNEEEKASLESGAVDLELWKASIKAITSAEEFLGLSLTEDQKLNAALHLYSIEITDNKSAVSALKLMLTS